jgi:hypothetical protein
MGLASLVAGRQQRVSFTPSASMATLGEKLGIDPRIGQPLRCGSGCEPFFSGAVALPNTIDNYVKGCHVWTT